MSALSDNPRAESEVPRGWEEGAASHWERGVWRVAHIFIFDLIMASFGAFGVLFYVILVR